MNEEQTNSGAETVTTTAQIVATDIIDSRFNAGDLMIALDCIRDDNGEKISIELDISASERTPKGGGEAYVPAIMTADKLKKIGYQYGDDFSQTDTLIDQKVDVYGKKQFSQKGTPYWVWNLSQGRKTAENKEERLKALMEQIRAQRAKREGNKTAPAVMATAPVPQPVPSAPTPAAARPNPFAKPLA